jgi:FkbM family methyltransferase
VELPNGRYAYEDVRGSALVLYHQVLEYFDPRWVVEPGMTVFDVGANTGLFSLEILHRTGGTARVVSFEPAPAVYALLVRNLTDQFPNAEVRPIKAAVADRRGIATFYCRPRASAMSSLGREYLATAADVNRFVEQVVAGDLPEVYRAGVPGWLRRIPRPLARWMVRTGFRRVVGRVEPVPCELTTVEAVVRDMAVERIDLLKIDVEGAEWEVLTGVGEAWPKVGAVTVEVHDMDGRVQKVCDLLRAKGLVDVRVDQEEVFRGTSVYSCWASRAK